MTDVIWKNIESHDGVYVARYQVSNTGLVRAHPDAKVRGSRRGRILFQSEDDRGYKQVMLWNNYKVTTIKVHRLVANAFLGERKHGYTVNHIDGNKENNAVNNLEFVSNKENMWHSHRVCDSRTFITIRGERMCIPEAIKKYGTKGIHSKMVARRISRLGWDIEDALMIPPQPTGRPKYGQITKIERESR